ncbi:Radical SAM domain protein [Denitrovibrio acetiphilus DSM 12809]|uniref:Radical SAM domain protein n=1 Tax=Denitrovibrio acetiphilus (strain DSM 12809 / NBRC 114555 / N2460) TaxID=522772 RepID=D4H522_DENA2|nr:radical SAM protein [Denitrovibrio acetiphilus]ADD69378.1 Radical SAM domain protein [Denitrovibrio acetiphilus DSM 12809]
MIFDLTKDGLNKVHSEMLKEEALIHLNAYEKFMQQVQESGMMIDDNTEAPVFAYKDKLQHLPGVSVGNSGHSLYYGEISPACLHCRTGERSMTVFHTLKCNRSCYFCANMNQANYNYFVKNINNALEEIINADDGNGFNSIALTGGEPLLLPEMTLDFFKACRKRYPAAHLRLYTNGDFLPEDLAKSLAEAGLDEVRISIKADENGYPEGTLGCIETAARHIPATMVEMPVIPGTIEVMKELLLQLDKIGCTGINVLEFLYPWINNTNYSKKGFKVKKRPYRVLYSYEYAGGLPVSGSAEECVELVRFASEKELKLDVHFCSLENKLTSQIFHHNMGIPLMPYEYKSEKDHFIKSIRAYGSNATKALKYFKKHGIEDYHSEAHGLKIDFHPKYVSRIRGLSELALTYNIAEEKDGQTIIREIKIDLVDPEQFDYENDI